MAASTTPADNGPNTPSDEGLSYAADRDGRKVLLAELGSSGRNSVGDRLWSKYRKWPMFFQVFDNLGPLPSRPPPG